MIEEATKNARSVAEKFAEDSESRLGKIRSAQQGQFSIEDRDSTTPHIKKVRVVSTVEYHLADSGAADGRARRNRRGDPRLLRRHGGAAPARLARGVPAYGACDADGRLAARLHPRGGRVVAVAGYRVSTNLFCGRHLYVDDLVTAEAERSKGHGKALLAWLRAQAVAEGLRRLPPRLRRAAQARARVLPARGPRAQQLPLQRAAEAAGLSVKASERPAPAMPRALTQATLAAGVRALARRDPDFAALAAKNGLPPMWARRPGFPTLVHIVLEQQVSIAAARSAVPARARPPRRHDARARRGPRRSRPASTRAHAAESVLLPRPRARRDERQPLALAHRRQRRCDRPLDAAGTARHRALERGHLLPDGAAAPGRVAGRRPRARGCAARGQAAAAAAGRGAPARDERRLGALALGRGAAPVALLSDYAQGARRTRRAAWIAGQRPSGKADLRHGKGALTTESKVLADAPYSFSTRFEGTPGTNPEELLGAAHAGCFTMALSQQARRIGHQARAHRNDRRPITFEKLDTGFTITRVHLDVTVQRARRRSREVRAGRRTTRRPTARSARC